MTEEYLIDEGGEVDWAGLRKDLEDFLVKTAKSIISDFTILVTRTWRHKPTFAVEGPRIEGDELRVYGVPKMHADIWHFVDLGTNPHPIAARSPGRPMRFQTGYKAKSNVYSLYGQSGGKFGDWRSAYLVKHPGIKARHFTLQSLSNHQEWFDAWVAAIFVAHGVAAFSPADTSAPVRSKPLRMVQTE